MGDRSSNSGVRNIRAMFEAKAEATSPPSRGRSPTGSERSSSSRPISKVRASFVAVERSGQIGLVRKDSADSAAGAPEFLRNGSAGSELQSRTGTSAGGSVTGNSEGIGHNLPLENVKEEDLPINESKSENLLKTDMKSKVSSSLPNGLGKDVSKASGTKSTGLKDTQSAKANEEKSANLGNVLKGSPFEPLPVVGGREGAEAPEKRAREPVTKFTKADSKPAGNQVNKLKSTQVGSKSAASHPAAITTKPSAPGVSKVTGGPQVGKSTKSPKAPRTPTTPKDSTASKTEPSKTTAAKVSTPKATQSTTDSKGLSKEPSKEPARKPSRVSLATQNISESRSKPSPSSNTSTQPMSKKSTPLAPKSQSQSPATTAQVKKSAQPSSSPFHKPPPKSPTKPVRLPASATAPTTSSAAKTGPGPITYQSTTTRTNRALSSKPSRPSLGPAPISHDRPVSRTSSRAPDEGFLARMMRSTTSSASKTHEKLEIKTTPPRKLASRPKRKSETAENGKVAEEESRSTQAGDVGDADVAERNVDKETLAEVPSRATATKGEDRDKDSMEEGPTSADEAGHDANKENRVADN